MLLEQQASSRENWCWTGFLSPLLYPGYKEWDRSLAGHLLIGWGMYTGRHVYFSLWGRRGDSLYCSCNMGEGRTIRVWFFCSCIPRPSVVLSALSSLGHHKNHFCSRRWELPLTPHLYTQGFLHLQGGWGVARGSPFFPQPSPSQSSSDEKLPLTPRPSSST